MLEISGCVMLALAGAFAGAAMSEDLKNDCRALSSLIKMLERIILYLGCEHLDTDEIICKLKQNSEFGLFELDLSADPYGVSDGVKAKYIGPDTDDSNILNNGLEKYFSSFGKKNMSEQLSLTELFKAEVESAYISACERSRKYGRIYRALGLSGGVALAIMLV